MILPALERGAVVVTDRYVDSSLAYQGAGRNQPAAEVARLNKWATGGLEPDLTMLLDLPPAGRARPPGPVRGPAGGRAAGLPRAGPEGFLALARAEPERYLVLDAAQARPS